MIDIIEADTRWQATALEDISTRAEAALAERLGLTADLLEISLLACGDERIAELNGEFRGKASPTNVLSWPAEALTPPALPEAEPDGTLPLGDIALAFETCAREAEAQGQTFDDHVTHLIVHGLLHLLGYDHEIDDDALRMEALEREILGKLGISDPYR